MEIRKMQITDYEDIRALWLSTPGMGLNNIDDSKEGIEKFLKRNPRSCFISEREGRITGVIMSGHDGRRGYIYHMAVAADERNQGIGTALLDHAMNALGEEGISKVALVVFASNETGNKFWEKRGFISREDLYYRNKCIKELTRMDT